MNKNKISVLGYIFLNIITSLLFFYISFSFYTLQISRASDLPLLSAVWITVAVYYATFIVCLILNVKNHRNYFSVAYNLLIPYSILNSVVLFCYTGTATFWCIAISVILPVFVFLIERIADKLPLNSLSKIFNAKTELDPKQDEPLQESNHNKESLSNKIRFIVAPFFAIFLISTVAALGYLGVYQSHYYTYEHNDIYYSEKSMSAEEIEIFSKIERRTWKNLSLGEKIDVLQKVANREAERLGIPHPPKVETEELYNKLYNVNFSSETNTVELDLNMVKHGNDGYNAVRALAHGVFYAYEDAKTKLVEYFDSQAEDISTYSNLINFEENKVNNLFSFERNAKAYSELIVAEFRRMIP